MKVQRFQPPCLAADVVAPGADGVAAILPPGGQRLFHNAAPGGGVRIGCLRQEAELIAGLVQFDLAKALEEATVLLPDPKAWEALAKAEAKQSVPKAA